MIYWMCTIFNIGVLINQDVSFTVQNNDIGEQG
jgi:hypothetical protein